MGLDKTQKRKKDMKAIKGKPKSGRTWKSDKKRKSDMINVKPLHTSWEKKKRIRAEKDSVKAFERDMKEAAKKERDEKRKRIEERKKRKEENQKKSEIVQEIKNTSKLKRLKKKQLRLISKR